MYYNSLSSKSKGTVRQRIVGELSVGPIPSKRHRLEYAVNNDENVNESISTDFDSSICE